MMCAVNSQLRNKIKQEVLFLSIHPGAVVQLLNSTNHGDEGDMIDVCAELVNVEGGLRRSLSIAVVIFSGTAECKSVASCAYEVLLTPSPLLYISRWCRLQQLHSRYTSVPSK